MTAKSPALLGLDAAFLYLENERSPMHIGSLILMQGESADGPFDFETFRRRLEQRVAHIPILRQRLVQDPTGLGSPSWVDDDDFDLDHHVQHTTLAAPGGWPQLRSLMAHEISRRLDRSRPLWEMLFVDGLGEIPDVPPGTVALISRMHHAAIDGVSGAEILGTLFDLTPDPGPQPAKPRWQPVDAPTDLELLLATGKRAIAKPFGLAKVVGRTVKGLAGSGALLALRRVKPPPVPFTAPRTPLNQPVGKLRSWDGVTLSLARIKAIKERVAGATVNDVVLTVCSGALRRYLGEHDALPPEPLVAMAPISVRGEDEKGALGNRVSAMLVPLATHLPDPLQRLEAIHRDAVGSKSYHRAIGADTLTDYSNFVPFSVAALAARLYTGMGAARLHKPAFNVVITNVPGPQVPLYLGGSRMLVHLGTAPLFDGIGLLLAIFSYDGGLGIGVTACRRLMPDVDFFTQALTQSLDELEAAVEGLEEAP